MIEINGATLEGGGQILRTAMALSVITQKECRIFNVRQKRDKPGLMPQHLLGIQALSYLCRGSLEGDHLGSTEIKFQPGKCYQKQITINIPTAASITLFLQTLIPPLFSAPKTTKISFNGGATDTFFSPSIDYFRFVFLKILERMGGKVEINILKRGYYPEGGARLEVKVYPSKLKELGLVKRGNLKEILIISGASQFLKSKRVAERQMSGVREILGKLKLPIKERVEYYPTQCPGSQVCLISQFEKTIIGSDNLGKLGKRAEDVGKEAAQELLKEARADACLDKYSSDQILTYLALSSKKSQFTASEITDHSKTNMWVIEKFVKGKFQSKGNLISWIPTS